MEMAARIAGVMLIIFGSGTSRVCLAANCSSILRTAVWMLSKPWRHEMAFFRGAIPREVLLAGAPKMEADFPSSSCMGTPVMLFIAASRFTFAPGGNYFSDLHS